MNNTPPPIEKPRSYEERVKSLADDIYRVHMAFLISRGKEIIKPEVRAEHIALLKDACYKSACTHLTPEEVIRAFCDFTIVSFLECRRKLSSEKLGLDPNNPEDVAKAIQKLMES